MNPTTTNATGPRIPAWLVLTGMELRLILRNRSMALTAIVMPLGFAGVILAMSDAATADLATMNLTMLAGFTVYMTATMTLAHHRAALFLKRVRSSPASTTGIVLGFATAPILLFVGQSLLFIAITGAVKGILPAQPLILVAAAVIGAVTCAALAFLTASFTKTPEAAHFTTMPGFAVLFGGLMWVLSTPPDEVTVPTLALPGTAVTQLLRYAWSGEGSIEMGLLWPAVASVTVAVLSCAVAARLFRWEPRD
ncbi:ABC transporter permease [Stackebrandtia nassauensis]|uniref:ABC-2 type transporter n=1 Tax=Stackebrandtia nassauensis (strain DSM 44728 / CIP 108903 / NRRL B-16338 / NBRC 102104 / LLR-40K-21) TaxID=446470 RepID=D3Q5S2_STANL|nr:ABC transporter permease [Stackebrandtia nassauensis]ADD40221.1 ABC-2 type transporter [Stackebrandtia nassauensis DSM 44728]